MIGGKRIWESRRNDVSADEWSETKVVRKEQIWERIKSRRKDKCGSETKVVRKANVGGKQKWGGGETIRKVKHSSVRIENPIPTLYRGMEYFSLAKTFRATWGESKNNSGQKKNKRGRPKGSASFDLCSSCQVTDKDNRFLSRKVTTTVDQP